MKKNRRMLGKKEEEKKDKNKEEEEGIKRKRKKKKKWKEKRKRKQGTCRMFCRKKSCKRVSLKEIFLQKSKRMDSSSFSRHRKKPDQHFFWSTELGQGIRNRKKENRSCKNIYRKNILQGYS
jgi:hypothetical protein